MLGPLSSKQRWVNVIFSHMLQRFFSSLQSGTFNALTLFGNVKCWSLWPCKNLLNQAHILIYPANIRTIVKFWIFICGMKMSIFSQNTKPIYFTVWNWKHVMKGRFVTKTLKNLSNSQNFGKSDLHEISLKHLKIMNFLNFFKHFSQIPIWERQIAQNYLKFCL